MEANLTSCVSNPFGAGVLRLMSTMHDSHRRIEKRQTVCFTVDAEPDCPPFLWSWRGIEEGAPKLFELLDELSVPATFFTTGDTAARYPSFAAEVVERGHELGCHGYSHHSFMKMTATEARNELQESSSILRDFGIVTSFRAPYLQLPEAFVPLLKEHGFLLDSSLAKYKVAYWKKWQSGGLTRIPTSITSSWLRLPPKIRNPILSSRKSPLVLFVHPWEFVDLRKTRIRWDCRAGTGPHALSAVKDVIKLLKDRGVHFSHMRDLVERDS